MTPCPSRRTPARLLLVLLSAAAAAAGAARASVSIYMTPESVAARASLVVEGHVARTASGYDAASGTLATYVTLDVSYVHRGPRELARVVVREAGGRFGDAVHDVDAVPEYRAGESVLAFLEPAPDGALRTAGLFFGKFALDAASGEARRELDGQGRIFGRPPAASERFRAADLAALAASRLAPGGSRRIAWRALPPEWERLQWDDVHEIATLDPSAPLPAAHATDFAPAREPAGEAPVAPSFVSSSTTRPARWQQADAGTPVTVHVQPAGNPLGDAAAAVQELQRAMAAWSNVPDSRIVLQPGNMALDYTGSYAQSPRASHSAINVMLFDDPYGDISDPVSCSGVLAIGGYWRSSSAGATINGVQFWPETQLYVIFNNDFECFLGDAASLAEVATHELGHGLGFGHSTTPDSIMRAQAYGGRGPRLGLDDRDAAHCHYPHTLTLTSPNGGESWAAGAARTIQWSASPESGADPGTVDLELSLDGGGTWSPLATGQPNDGHHAWSVPATPTASARVRVVRRVLGSGAPAGYPATCSGDASNGSFSIVGAPALAGELAAGSLRLAKAAAGVARLSWDASCSAAVDGHAVYEGSLDALRAGSWDPVARTCSAGSDLVEDVAWSAGDRYYLVAPLAGGAEGRYGRSSSGLDRPAAALACAAREADSTCP